MDTTLSLTVDPLRIVTVDITKNINLLGWILNITHFLYNIEYVMVNAPPVFFEALVRRDPVSLTGVGTKPGRAA